MIKVLAITPEKVSFVNLAGLTSIGGTESSGVCLQGLRGTEDYAVISIMGSEVSIHPLRGKQRGSVKLLPLQSLALDDLTLFAFELEEVHSANSESDSQFLSNLPQLIESFSESQDLKVSMTMVLESLVDSMEMEKGLLIARNGSGTFEIIGRKNIETDEPWLSETLIQQTLSQQKSISIQNIYGSAYDSNKSLMATGFISVFTWPLSVRGESLGLILVGSLKPHSGLTLEQRRKAEMLARLSGLMLWFHLRDVKLKEEVEALRQSRQNPEDSPLLTSFAPLIDTIEVAKKVAPTELNILIEGETGVGKELLANWIHKKSERSKNPFVAINCGAIPHELLESILFGHKKGAFTGAHADQLGKFQLAEGGTLFLDEIGDLPEILQVKLLRALQERVIEPLGSPRGIKINVRIIAATHKSLPGLIGEKKFREDLYFRLAEIILQIPSLRERPNDIVLLATSFLKNIAAEKRFSMEAWNWLKRNTWPGNVRELLSSIKRAAILSAGTEIKSEDLTRGLPSLQVKSGTQDWLGASTLEEAKNIFIQEKVQAALLKSGGQRNKAAELLGITTRTLFRYLENRPVEGETDVSV